MNAKLKSVLLVIILLPLVTRGATNQFRYPPPPPGAGVIRATKILARPLVEPKKGAEQLTSSALLAQPRFAPAAVVEDPILFNPVLVDESGWGFGTNFWSEAHQAANKELVVDRVFVLGGDAFTIAHFLCWPEEQVFFVVTAYFPSGNLFMVGHNPPCPPFSPASADKYKLGAVRAAKVRDKYRIVAEVLGVETAPGVRIFKEIR